MNTIIANYQTVKPIRGRFLIWMVVMALLVVVGAYCAYTMEHEGHHITGMNNRIVWGLPHVFAISLILAASGALNGATLSSVFGQQIYKPVARLSAVLAICLLISGLLVLVLDLGRPDRLSVAMTHYNFRSIFSWNIFLYTGFIAVVVVYLSTMLERSLNRFNVAVGVLALLWRIVLTTGTGCIFGFLVGRSALDSAILAPLFIALSLVMGTVVMVLAMELVAQWRNHPVAGESLARETGAEDTTRPLAKLLLVCSLVLLYFSVVHHLTNLYAEEHRIDGQVMFSGPVAIPFWLGHVALVAVIVWLAFKLKKTDASPPRLQWLLCCIIALLGCALLLYSIIVGSQAAPQELFPGKIVTASSFGDAAYASYLPTLWEWGLGIGGVALSVLLLGFVLRVLPVSGYAIKEHTTDTSSPPSA